MNHQAKGSSVFVLQKNRKDRLAYSVETTRYAYSKMIEKDI